jgi:DNA-binding NarL/FixJ family response regulator
VIVDLSLGRDSGLELIRTISNVNDSIGIVVLSMHDDAIFSERALRAGARGYVNKREATEVLVTAVRRIVRGEVWLSARASKVILESVIAKGPSRTSAKAMRLSDRELEVLRLLGAGVGTRKIARRLVVSVKTVESHRAHLKEKLGLGDRSRVPRIVVRTATASSPTTTSSTMYRRSGSPRRSARTTTVERRLHAVLSDRAPNPSLRNPEGTTRCSPRR